MSLNHNSAVSAALAGLADAQNQALQAAQSVVEGGVDAIPDAAIALMMAKTQTQASAVTLRTLDQIQGSLLDILA